MDIEKVCHLVTPILGIAALLVVDSMMGPELALGCAVGWLVGIFIVRLFALGETI